MGMVKQHQSWCKTHNSKLTKWGEKQQLRMQTHA